MDVRQQALGNLTNGSTIFYCGIGQFIQLWPYLEFPRLMTSTRPSLKDTRCDVAIKWLKLGILRAETAPAILAQESAIRLCMPKVKPNPVALISAIT